MDPSSLAESVGVSAGEKTTRAASPGAEESTVNGVAVMGAIGAESGVISSGLPRREASGSAVRPASVRGRSGGGTGTGIAERTRAAAFRAASPSPRVGRAEDEPPAPKDSRRSSSRITIPSSPPRKDGDDRPVVVVVVHRPGDDRSRPGEVDGRLGEVGRVASGREGGT